MDALGGVVCDELGGWVVGVEFDLVNSWDNLVLLVSTPHYMEFVPFKGLQGG